MEIQVKNRKLLIDDCEFNNYVIEKEISSDANGIVYLAKNLTLERDE